MELSERGGMAMKNENGQLLPKQNCRFRDGFFTETGASKSSTALLGLNDSRRDEEDQLLVRGINLCVTEQIAQDRNISQQGHLRDIDGVLRLDDAANHHRTAIG